MAAGQTVVGRFNVAFEATTTGLAQGVDNAGKQMNKLAKSTNQVAKQAEVQTRASRRTMQGMLELSRGFEDASVLAGTQGFAGVLRGASNNMAQFAFLVGGPAVGAVAGFGIALLGLAVPAIKKMMNHTDVARDSLEDFNKELAKRHKFDPIQFDKKLLGLDDADAARGLESSLEKDLAKLEADYKAKSDKLKNDFTSDAEFYQKRLDELNAGSALIGEAAMPHIADIVTGGFLGPMARLRDALKKAKEEGKPYVDELVKINEELNVLRIQHEKAKKAVDELAKAEKDAVIAKEKDRQAEKAIKDELQAKEFRKGVSSFKGGIEDALDPEGKDERDIFRTFEKRMEEFNKMRFSLPPGEAEKLEQDIFDARQRALNGIAKEEAMQALQKEMKNEQERQTSLKKDAKRASDYEKRGSAGALLAGSGGAFSAVLQAIRRKSGAGAQSELEKSNAKIAELTDKTNKLLEKKLEIKTVQVF